MSSYTKLQNATTKMKEALEDVNELDVMLAAVFITMDRWLSDRGVANHFKTKVARELWEGFKVQEDATSGKVCKRDIEEARSDNELTIKALADGLLKENQG